MLRFIAQALSARDKSRRGKRGSATYNPNRENEVSKIFIISLLCVRRVRERFLSGAIIGDGDRKSWDSRGPMIWDNFSFFRTNCAILTSWIHARVVGSRVDVVTLRDQLVRVARFSCRIFTAMAGNKAEKKNQGSSVYFYALMQWKRCVFQGL